MAETKGTGWVTYAGIMLIVSGMISIIDAIWAFRYKDTLVDLVFFENNIQTWGVIWLIVGVVLIAAGFGVFSAQSWARVTGIVAASVAVLSNLSWAEVQPQQSLIGALLGSLVIYGLAVHGDVDAI
jgi:uncharacterized membrane protein HdeD (DUF308 family)